MIKYLAVFLVSILALLLWQNNLIPGRQESQTSSPVEEQKKASVEIVVDSQMRRYPDVDFKEGETALDLTRKAVEVETKGEGEMAFVTSVNGQKVDEEKKEFWSLWVNGEMAQVGAGSYVLKSGDTVTWKIQTY